MKKLTESQTALFIAGVNELCQRHGVVITAHCLWPGYGEDGLAAHCLSNAPNAGASAAQAEEALIWYRDGNLREHKRQ